VSPLHVHTSVTTTTRPRGAQEDALDWWDTLSYDEKAGWLQCEAGPDEIDEELRSPDQRVRDAAGIAAVGDAWHAYLEERRT
jgi:hypothetical protein